MPLNTPGIAVHALRLPVWFPRYNRIANRDRSFTKGGAIRALLTQSTTQRLTSNFIQTPDVAPTRRDEKALPVIDFRSRLKVPRNAHTIAIAHQIHAAILAMREKPPGVAIVR